MTIHGTLARRVQPLPPHATWGTLTPLVDGDADTSAPWVLSVAHGETSPTLGSTHVRPFVMGASTGATWDSARSRVLPGASSIADTGSQFRRGVLHVLLDGLVERAFDLAHGTYQLPPCRKVEVRFQVHAPRPNEWVAAVLGRGSVARPTTPRVTDLVEIAAGATSPGLFRAPMAEELELGFTNANGNGAAGATVAITPSNSYSLGFSEWYLLDGPNRVRFPPGPWSLREVMDEWFIHNLGAAAKTVVVTQFCGV